MKICDIKRIQQYTNGEKLYLVQQGLFYHAFNEAAEYLAPITGYRIRKRFTADGDTYSLLGFPIDRLPHVINICGETDNNVDFLCEKTIVKIIFKTKEV